MNTQLNSSKHIWPNTQWQHSLANCRKYQFRSEWINPMQIVIPMEWNFRLYWQCRQILCFHLRITLDCWYWDGAHRPFSSNSSGVTPLKEMFFLFSKQFSLIHFRIPSTGKAASSEIGRQWPIFYEIHWDYAFKTFVLMATPLEMHYQIVQFSVPLVASRHFAYENPAVIEMTQWKKKKPIKDSRWNRSELMGNKKKTNSRHRFIMFRTHDGYQPFHIFVHNFDSFVCLELTRCIRETIG